MLVNSPHHRSWKTIAKFLAIGPLALATLPAVAQTGPTVWVVPSLTRVGQTDAPGTTTEGQLEAAKGEYESFQIIVKAPSGGLSNVNVTMSDLTGPGGAIIPKSSYSLFREYYVNVSVNSPAWSGSSNMPGPTGWYPDGLIPFIDPATGLPPSGGSIPAAPFNVSGGQNQPVWVDLQIPRGATAGQYSGTYTVTSAQGNFTGTVAVTVWNFTLPVNPSLHSSFQYWSAGSLGANEELLRNRIEPLSVPASTETTLMPYGLHDDNLGYWSGANIGNCTMSSAPSVSQIQSTASAQASGIGLYDYSADEVGSCTNLYTTIQQWGYNLHQAGVNQLITIAPVTALFSDGSGTGRSAVDIWVVLPDMYDGDVPNIQTALAKGDQVWSYNTLVQDSYSPKWEIDFAPINFRIQPGFINQSLGLNGLLYWRIDLWSSDPWNNVYAYGNYPGEGQLVYPGSTVGVQGVAPSMRLKWLRDGADDYDYVQLMKAAGQGSTAMQIANSVGLNWSTWTRDPNAVYSARHQLGVALDSLNGGSSSSAPPPPLPTAPTNPAPANAASGVSTSTNLTWTGDTYTTSYDVHLGTSPTPPLVSSVTTPSYTPASLAAGTTYYWQVVAKNSSGSTSSPIWSFTTQVGAPSAPTNLVPANGATGVSLTPTLSWTGATYATSYSVYFGTTSNPPLVGTTTSTSYSPGTLTAGTTYYWQVAANDATGSTLSGVQSFVTASSTTVSGSGAVVPSSGSGMNQTFQFTFSDPNGRFDIAGGTVIISSPLQWANSCWIYYACTSNQIYLASDDKSTWSSATPGSATVLQNSQCAIDVSGVSVSGHWKSITVAVPLYFKSSYAGLKTIFMATNSKTSGQPTPSAQGTWYIP